MLLASSGVSRSTSKTYVDDCFGVQLRTGNGTSQSVTTGFQPDLVWTKSRSATTGHRLVDSARGTGNSLESNSTLAQQSEATGITAFNSSGYSVGADSDYNTNTSTYVDWVWKKAPKFFDVVTYTGDGTSNRQIPHSLGVAPGMVIVKATSAASNWWAWHRGNGVSDFGGFALNTTGAATPNYGLLPYVTDTYVRVGWMTSGSAATPNDSGVTYVAYLFAHDPSADGIIQCGIGTTLNLGWEPQFILFKNPTASSNWEILDTTRGWANSVNASQGLRPNTNELEQNWNFGSPTASGTNPINGATQFIYLAIRRSNKPPTSGTQVYNAIARTGTGAAATVTGVGFAPDALIGQVRGTSGYWNGLIDRLRGAARRLVTSQTTAEDSATTAVTSFGMDGVNLGSDSNGFVNESGRTYINHFFRRAPGFFSSFAYTGTGSNTTQNHDLAAIPDLLIVKSRSAATDWQVWCNGLAANEKLVLNSTAGKVTDATAWNSTLPTSTNISLGTASATNDNTATFIAYAFSNLPGIQKIGTYVGDGTSGRVIDCGFSTGARFVCIKAISTTGSWLVADSTRGIVSGNDPYLQLNSTAAEVTTEDWLDPASIGFIVNNVASSNANTNGVTYMFWAIS